MKKAYLKNPIFMYMLAFIIPAVMMTVAFFWLGFLPLDGNSESILVADIRYQFSDYFSYFKSVIAGENNIFYTFSSNLGGDAIGFFAYYLQNPLNFIYLFFSQDMIPVGIMIVIIITAGISGLSFNIYLNHIAKEQWFSLLFSTAYAFIGFFTAYINCMLYTFDIAILPIVMLGIHRIMKDYRKKNLYMFSLAAVIIVNYYTGYMICLFSVLFFASELIREMKTKRDIRTYKKTIFSFATASLLGGALAAFDLIPTLLSLSGEKDQATFSKISLNKTEFYFPDVFSQLYSKSFNGNISDGYPLLYVGIFALIFLGFFLFNKNVNRKEKVVAISFLSLLLVCFWSHVLNVFWHGFNEPIGFPHRNAFIFSFLVLHYAYRGFLLAQEKAPERKCFIIQIIIFVIYSAYLFISRNTIVGGQIILFNFVFLLAFLISLYLFYYQPKWKTIGIFLIVIIQCIELTSNAISSISMYPTNDLEDYQQFITDTREIVNDIKENDQSFYRMEKTFKRTHNDAMQFQYNGLSHFSSVEKKEVTRFMGKMGFRNYGSWASYNDGSTMFADCFLGVKYLLSQWDAIGKSYDRILEEPPYYAYQNAYALPIGFGITKDILDVNMEQTNLFEIQSEIADSFKAKNKQIFKPVEVMEVIPVNLNQNGKVYTKINKDEEAYLEYKLKIDSTDLIYVYLTAEEIIQDAEIFVNETSKGDYFTVYDWDIDEIGDYKIGDEISFRVVTHQDTLTVDEAFIYYEDEEAIAKWYEQSDIVKWSPERISSSHLKGMVQMTEDYDYLMMTLPYEKDWIVKIDGKEVETIKILDALMAIEVDAGEHEIEMYYVPSGLYVGVSITLLAICMIIIMVIYNKKKYKE